MITNDKVTKPKAEREFHAFEWYMHFGQFLNTEMKNKIKTQMI